MRVEKPAVLVSFYVEGAQPDREDIALDTSFIQSFCKVFDGQEVVLDNVVLKIML